MYFDLKKFKKLGRKENYFNTMKVIYEMPLPNTIFTWRD
jgi:hypothetical protein